ncbi:Short-chain dehydrogenase TIC 32 [Paramyrothecium foliicola]|nr:Short-chain dehydrogenase TIC 32 [Paramyrothecium foliicola]
MINETVADCYFGLRKLSPVSYLFEKRVDDIGPMVPDLRGQAMASVGPKLIRSDAKAPVAVKVPGECIDISRLKGWIKHCNESHTESCHAINHELDTGPRHLLLIDVDKNCLALLGSSTRYMTLSYAWGNLPQTLQCLTSNIDQLKMQDALNPDDPNVLLPQTIRDAMRLVKQLGEQYLWVDRLCIVQDDSANKSFHINRMDAIYARSYCTVVAADGKDSDAGLPGVPGGSSKRSYTQSTLLLPGCSFLAGSSELGQSSWCETRAWVYQELRLSRRCLVFRGQTVYWSCPKSAYEEQSCSTPEGVDHYQNDPLWNRPVVTNLDLRAWTLQVSQYNTTDLTDPSDAHAAFMGIENVLRPCFQGGFVYGLPQYFFDFAMLWRPRYPLEKRKIQRAKYTTLSTTFQQTIKMASSLNPYATLYASPNGPGDARPTALQVIQDSDLAGKWVGKVVLITGGASGYGAETAKALHTTGADIYITGRDAKKAQGVIDDIKAASESQGKLEFIEMDMRSLESVKNAAKSFLERSSTLNILVNNAGIMAVPEFTKTIEGFEEQFGVNHLAHYAFTAPLLPTLISSSTPSFQSRIISLTSSGHRIAPTSVEDYNFDGGYHPWVAYGRSKTANIWFSNYIERAYGARGVHANAVHPGPSVTPLHVHTGGEVAAAWAKEPSMQAPDQGAATSIWAATASALEGKGGLYLANCTVGERATADDAIKDPGFAAHAFDEEGEKKLWELSEKLTGVKVSV